MKSTVPAILALAVLFAVTWMPSAHGQAIVSKGDPCQSGQVLDPYVVWRRVWTRHDAKELVLATYAKIGRPENLADWFRCQDFHVLFVRGPTGHVKAGDAYIDAIFFVAPRNRKPLWVDGIVSPYNQSVRIRFSADNSISSLVLERTVE